MKQQNSLSSTSIPPVYDCMVCPRLFVEGKEVGNGVLLYPVHVCLVHSLFCLLLSFLMSSFPSCFALVCNAVCIKITFNVFNWITGVQVPGYTCIHDCSSCDHVSQYIQYAHIDVYLSSSGASSPMAQYVAVLCIISVYYRLVNYIMLQSANWDIITTVSVMLSFE